MYTPYGKLQLNLVTLRDVMPANKGDFSSVFVLAGYKLN